MGFSPLLFNLAVVRHLFEPCNPLLLCFQVLFLVMRSQRPKVGGVASWDVVGGASIKDPVGHGESV